MCGLGLGLANSDPDPNQVATTGAAAALRLSFKDGVGNSTADGHAGGLIAGCNDVALVRMKPHPSPSPSP